MLSVRYPTQLRSPAPVTSVAARKLPLHGLGSAQTRPRARASLGSSPLVHVDEE